ncbi:hypothetical protein BJ138DRAFT_1131478 [Hygrophoropsis aurantiaca]|uniref:Uncharacterized protein n=1 Tax=Hygrophoropsis aurantiaca TaxID=72124 RepID=A0ACB7ZQW6_9AGAM|nr:hypothetical protein BJ138DRAFT_1131478 [Hygrophoropsis aurantiaca]
MCAAWGAVNIPTLNTGLLQARGALGLSTAAMERAIKLFADKNIFLGDIDVNGKGKPAKALHKHNKSTGKESSMFLAFSETNWGVITNSYTRSIINRHGEELIVAVSDRAREIASKRRGLPARTTARVAATTNEDDSEDERALI